MTQIRGMHMHIHVQCMQYIHVRNCALGDCGTSVAVVDLSKPLSPFNTEIVARKLYAKLYI